MKVSFFKASLIIALGATASLVSPAQAAFLFNNEAPFVSPSPDLVTPGDTFSFSLAGFNSASGQGFLLFTPQNVAFGTTQTYMGLGPNGQDITISSSETVGATTTTDTFTLSTPTNFLTTTTFGGITITALQFDLGTANSGSNTVSLVLPITSTTSSGSILFSGGTFALTPTVTISAGGSAYAGVEGVNSGTSAISTFAVRSFTLTVNYATVPEPSTLAFVSLGLAGAGIMIVARRRRTVA